MKKIIIVDKNDRQIWVKERWTLGNDDIYRVSALMVFNKQWEVLLAQRSFLKRNSPWVWNTSVAGTNDEGESYLSNILKEAEEEIGLKINKSDIIKLFKTYKKWVNNYFCTRYWIILNKKRSDFILQKDEVEKIQFLSIAELKKFWEPHPEYLYNRVKRALDIMKDIIIVNKNRYNSIIDNVDKDWKKSVHFLVDFDKTLTKAFIKGKEFPSLISILRNDENILGKEYAKKAHELYDFYHKIEVNPNINKKEKVKKMSEWWRKHQELLVKSWLTKKHIQQAIDSGYLEFRDWIKTFIKNLEKKHIPLVIISANGIGWDSIKMFFEKFNLMSENIYIISNVLQFDKMGVTCWFKNKVIHSFNKSEAVIKDFPKIYQKIKNRKNVILMGDSLGDPYMIDGFEYKNLLKIGFLNNRSDISLEDEPELFNSFKENYDIILSWDSNLQFVNNILDTIN